MANLIAVLLTVGVAVAVLRPLFTAQSDADEENSAVQENLLQRKTLLEASLRDLDLEHEMRSLSEADYQQLRRKTLAEAQAVEDQLQRLTQAKPTPQPNRKRRRK